MNNGKSTDNENQKSESKIRMTFILTSAILVIFLIILYVEGGRKEPAKNEARKFGATYMTMNNPYFDVLNESIKDVVEANGDFLITRDPLQNQDKQNSQILEMIDEGVVAIFLNPVDWKNVRPALEACREAGVPVFNIDTSVYNTEYVVTQIMSDNYNAGVQCANDIIQKSSHADIVILDDPDTNSIIERIQGFLDTLEGHEEYQIVAQKEAGGELEVAMDVMDGIIKEGITFDIVMGGNDPTALGALAAIQANHVGKDVYIYGVDGSPDGKGMIKEGLLEGSSSQKPSVIGKTAAETAYSYLQGEEIEEYIVVPVTLITRGNLSEFDIDGWE